MTKHGNLPFSIVRVSSHISDAYTLNVLIEGKRMVEIVGRTDTWIYCRNSSNFVYFRFLN